MHRNLRSNQLRPLGAAGRLSIFAALVSVAWPMSLAAQTAQAGGEPSPGSLLITREVPTRPAQATGSGDILEVSLIPNQAFEGAIRLGISELDDAQAAQITSSALDGIDQFSQIASATRSSNALVSGALERNGLVSPNGITETGGGSVVASSIGSGLGSANAAVNSALGSLSRAIGAAGSSNGGGQ
ncbi:hypothetical protein EH31_13435 [Erythrobacter longus]|uniref:Uncharacterized protein n=1 Tax=Erythrobacter longus TaxID=1044 RepID=A0A074M6P0_ERYLO|nr:hypothetical protein [Erythrobacter longus]KEO89044.1 hypothetical protein EH31_13435 [Erythrobacter longus]